MAVRTRIAPSPTGPLHTGTARTTLFNYLFTKKQSGEFIARIEDTDIERSDPKYEAEILESLEWLGIAADESPIRGGPHGPYRQSERLASYPPYLERLLANGQAYYCPHSEEELEAERKRLWAAGRPPLHQCEYRGSKKSERGIIRFTTPAGRRLAFDDIIRGAISFESDLIGDFSIAKDLKTPLYNLAVVIDDYEMKISHVIRGEDHIPNTPKQMLIAEALRIPSPAYAHLPLILGPDRAKLSKRHGATAIGELRDQGYLPEAVVNFMALLGWNPGGDSEIFSMAELIRNFDLAKVQKSGAIFNLEKLDWMNGEYIRNKSPAELTTLAVPYLSDFLQFSIPNDQFSSEYIEKVITLEQPRLKKLSEIGERVDYFFREPEYDRELLHWKIMSEGEVAESLRRSQAIVESIPNSDFAGEKNEMLFLAEIGENEKGKTLWPLRVALTGKKASPGPFDIMAILGKDKTIARLAQAMAKISHR